MRHLMFTRNVLAKDTIPQGRYDARLRQPISARTVITLSCHTRLGLPNGLFPPSTPCKHLPLSSTRPLHCPWLHPPRNTYTPWISSLCSSHISCYSLSHRVHYPEVRYHCPASQASSLVFQKPEVHSHDRVPECYLILGAHVIFLWQPSILLWDIRSGSVAGSSYSWGQ